jgi:TPP-dependent pyruvate/acetoin dehydrogenase alpha subunit
VRDSDPIALLARALVDEGKLSQRDIELLDASALKEAAEAKEFALQSPIPAPETAMDYIFA